MGDKVSNSTIRSPNSPLPEGWRWVRLGEVCDGDSGVWGDVPDSSKDCYPILRSNNIQDGAMVLGDVAVRKVIEPSIVEAKSLKTGDILVTTSSGSKDLLGKSALFLQPSDGQKYLFSNFTMRLRLKVQIVEPFFLYFYLQSSETKQVLRLLQDTTTGLRNLDRKEFLVQAIPLPPLPRQKRIAAKVQELMAEVERARTACEKQLEAAKALPSAYLRQVFESEEAKKWEGKKLGELFHVQQGVAMSPARREGISPHPFLRTLNVLWGHIDLSMLDEMDFTDEEVAKLSLKPNDLLVCEGGEVGRTAIWRGELRVCLYQNHIHRLRRLNDNVVPDFYMYWMQAAFKVFGAYSGQESKTTIPNLSGSQLKSFKVPRPSIEEQKRIASELRDKISWAEKLKAAIQKQLEAINALPQVILRKAFAGEM